MESACALREKQYKKRMLQEMPRRTSDRIARKSEEVSVCACVCGWRYLCVCVWVEVSVCVGMGGGICVCGGICVYMGGGI